MISDTVMSQLVVFGFYENELTERKIIPSLISNLNQFVVFIKIKIIISFKLVPNKFMLAYTVFIILTNLFIMEEN